MVYTPFVLSSASTTDEVRETRLPDINFERAFSLFREDENESLVSIKLRRDDGLDERGELDA